MSCRHTYKDCKDQSKENPPTGMLLLKIQGLIASSLICPSTLSGIQSSTAYHVGKPSRPVDRPHDFWTLNIQISLLISFKIPTAVTANPSLNAFNVVARDCGEDVKQMHGTHVSDCKSAQRCMRENGAGLSDHGGARKNSCYSLSYNSNTG